MLNPDHLLELANEEAQLHGAGAPRQAVLRRAVSSAYYALFHALMGCAAQVFVPAGYWKSRVLFYRALDHRTTRERCRRAGQNPLPQAESAFFDFETGSFPDSLRFVANEFVRLQELRHRCDYDPDFKIAKEQVVDAIATARSAVDKLWAESPAYRVPFLSYLLFGLRA